MGNERRLVVVTRVNWDTTAETPIAYGGGKVDGVGGGGGGGGGGGVTVPGSKAKM